MDLKQNLLMLQLNDRRISLMEKFKILENLFYDDEAETIKMMNQLMNLSIILGKSYII